MLVQMKEHAYCDSSCCFQGFRFRFHMNIRQSTRVISPEIRAETIRTFSSLIAQGAVRRAIEGEKSEQIEPSSNQKDELQGRPVPCSKIQLWLQGKGCQLDLFEEVMP